MCWQLYSSIYIVLAIISYLEMITSIREAVYKLHANTVPFYIRYLSIHGLWYLGGGGFWNQCPADIEGQLYSKHETHPIKAPTLAQVCSPW